MRKKIFMVALLALSPAIETQAHDWQGLNAHRTHLPQDLQDELADRRDQLRTSRFVSDANETISHPDWIWPSGMTLNMCFMDGDPAVQNEVVSLAKEVVAHAGLDIDAGGESPRICDEAEKMHVRVRLSGDGSWAHVGTLAEQYAPQSEPTVQLGSINTIAPLSEDSRGTVRHEFLHVLGLIHEHQHPDAGCLEDIDLDKFTALYGWSEEVAKFNLSLLDFLAHPDIDASVNDLIIAEYDPESLTHYALDPSVFVDENSPCLVPKTNVLSERDILFIKQLYVD